MWKKARVETKQKKKQSLNEGLSAVSTLNYEHPL